MVFSDFLSVSYFHSVVDDKEGGGRKVMQRQMQKLVHKTEELIIQF